MARGTPVGERVAVRRGSAAGRASSSSVMPQSALDADELGDQLPAEAHG
jgi:hypothetical protein